MSQEQMGIDTSRRNRIPRPLTDDERARLDEFIDSIHYSTRSVFWHRQALTWRRWD
jgi:cyclin-dependent kinase regulatory subunit CKS1